ncbi:EF-hand domain-containing protein [Brevundimonas subvibrioides]|uniref:EF-hand domain-containing protein n=1 Tax=Brevundimonas subvibrioides TaxID=74313 RepID=UPI0022B4C76C|nr:EF-hand domain-containing protein [Brevundimonas subvibrioides]
MSSLLGAQEHGHRRASDVIDAADTNGDGTVSLDELAASLRADPASLTDAFARVDGDDDGQITADELEAGLQAAHGHRGPPPPPPLSASDLASSILASSDTDGGGSLSLSEITASLGQDDSKGLSDVFAGLDTNGDGGLGVEELTTAVEASFARQMAAYTANGTGERSSIRVAA